uniref:Uncharacterized protein n=1 Tax=Eutreptiella gymnastica TaxID=73025 RepID=A0A7S4LN85_9EUGL
MDGGGQRRCLPLPDRERLWGQGAGRFRCGLGAGALEPRIEHTLFVSLLFIARSEQGLCPGEISAWGRCGGIGLDAMGLASHSLVPVPLCVCVCLQLLNACQCKCRRQVCFWVPPTDWGFPLALRPCVVVSRITVVTGEQS